MQLALSSHAVALAGTAAQVTWQVSRTGADAAQRFHAGASGKPTTFEVRVGSTVPPLASGDGRGVAVWLVEAAPGSWTLEVAWTGFRSRGTASVPAPDALAQVINAWRA